MRRFIKLFAALCLSFILLLLLLPTILTTSLGNKTVVSWANKDLPGNISLSKMTLSWFGTQEISGLRYQSQDGSFSFVAETLDIDAPLIKLIFNWNSINDIILNGFESEIKGSSPIVLKNGRAQASLNNGILSLHSEAKLIGVQEPFALEAIIPLNKSFENAYVSIKNLPSQLIDEFLSITNKSQRHTAYDIFGKKFSITFNPGVLNIESDNLNGKIPFKIVEGTIISQEVGLLTLELPPQMLTSHIALTNKTSVSLEVQSFSIPMSLTDRANALFTLKIPESSISFHGTQGELNSIKMEIQFQKGVLNFNTALKLRPLLAGPYKDIADETFEIQANGIGFLKNGSLSIEDLALRADSQNHHFDALLNYDDQKFTLLSPASIRLKIDPAHINGLEFAKMGAFNLKKPAHIVLSLTPSKSPIDLNNLMGTVTMDCLDFFSYGNEFVFKDLFAPFEFVDGERRLKISPTLKTFLPKFNKEGAIAGKIALSDWDSVLKGKAQIQLIDIPTEIFDSLSSYNISRFLGPIASLNLDAHYENKLNVQANLEGKDLSATLSLETDDTLTVQGDKTRGNIDFILDNEKLKAITHLVKKENFDSKYALIEPTRAQLTLSSLTFSPSKKIAEAGFVLDVHVDKFLLQDLHRKTAIRLSDLKGHVTTNSLSDNINFKLQALPENGDRAHGSLNIDAHVSHMITKEGSLNHEDAQFDIKASSLSLRFAPFCDLFCPYPSVTPKLEALLGNLLDADVRLNIQKMSGSILANIRGGNGFMKLNGKLDQGILYLNEPLVAEVKATPALGKYVLSDVTPFLRGLESSNSPFRFTIQNVGFALPVSNFNLDKIVIKNASLETGKMVFKNSPEISSLISLLNGEQKELQTLWLTPVYFSMKEGKIKLQRADMLVSDTYHFAAWGNADLTNKRVDMIVAVAGNTISQALGVTGLKRDSMLQIPFKGPLSNPKLDKAKAAAKISSLVASNQGPEGAILGTFIDLASGSFLEQDPPPPTTNPLPWGEVAEARVDEKIQEKKAKASPLDEIEKGSKHLLKKIFNQ